MRTNVTGKGIELTPAISEYLAKRMQKVEELLAGDESALAMVELGKTTNHHKNGDIFRAEINLHTKSKDFFLFAEREDLYVAIDIMKDEICEQLQNWKDKKVSMSKRGQLAVKNALKGIADFPKKFSKK